LVFGGLPLFIPPRAAGGARRRNSNFDLLDYGLFLLIF
jgi:hypothetical protein